MSMLCKFCGQECKAGATLKLWTKYGPACKGSPSGNHVIVSDGLHCVYCGHECKPISTGLITRYGKQCPHSPTGKHALQ